MLTRTITFQVFEYHPTLEIWMEVEPATNDEKAARESLDYWRKLYPDAKYRLVKVECEVTVI